ncbi:MAG: DUF2325 domain-containing protein [Acetobacteraceae bacterium]|nr:DUF2325 domain-containing protein [Acetobacteraceae bacterium]
MDGAIFTLRPTASRMGASSTAGFILPPRLIAREPIAADPAVTRRTRIWEFSTNLHCSIVGTCLSTTELRQVLGKIGAAPPGSTDHDLHHTAVSLAGRHDQAAKLLHKALDQRHKLAINRFAKASDEAALTALWREAVKNGDIPGAYWAALTHPATTPDLVRLVFGEVHMLSHLVGAANRADIRRLAELEEDNARLNEKLQKQQQRLHEAVTSRDSHIQALQRALAERIGADSPAPRTGSARTGDAPEGEPPENETPANETPANEAPVDETSADEMDALRHLVATLQSRFDRETHRRAAAEQRAAEARDALVSAKIALTATQGQVQALQDELAILERSIETEAELPDLPRLDGLTLLYVGGRPPQAAAVRTLAEQQGAAAFEHHDGGVEDALALLPGLAGRADLVLFPVDCVSHQAALAVKKLCRQGDKRFVPLRTSSAASFLAALRRIA